MHSSSLRRSVVLRRRPHGELSPDDFAEMSVAVEGFATWAGEASYDSLVQARVDLHQSIGRNLTREAV